MKPGKSRTSTGVLSSASARSRTVANVASGRRDAANHLDQLHHRHRVHECIPMTRSGFDVTAPRTVIEIDDVFDARIVSGGRVAIEIAKQDSVSDRGARSPPRSPGRSPGRQSAAAGRCARARDRRSISVILPFSTSRFRRFAIRSGRRDEFWPHRTSFQQHLVALWPRAPARCRFPSDRAPTNKIRMGVPFPMKVLLPSGGAPLGFNGWAGRRRDHGAVGGHPAFRRRDGTTGSALAGLSASCLRPAPRRRRPPPSPAAGLARWAGACRLREFRGYATLMRMASPGRRRCTISAMP